MQTDPAAAVLAGRGACAAGVGSARVHQPSERLGGGAGVADLQVAGLPAVRMHLRQHRRVPEPHLQHLAANAEREGAVRRAAGRRADLEPAAQPGTRQCANNVSCSPS